MTSERTYELLPILRRPDEVMSWSQRLLVRLNAAVGVTDKFIPQGRYTVLSPRMVTEDQLPTARGVERILVLEAGLDRHLIFSDGVAWFYASDSSEV